MTTATGSATQTGTFSVGDIPEPTPDPAPTPAPDPAPPAPPEPAASSDADNPWDDPDKAKAEIERLRRENGNARTVAKENAAREAREQMAQEIGKAIGLVKDDEKADPEKLARQLTDARAATRDTAAELVVWRNAKELGVDPQAVTDSRAFARAIQNLDPSDAKAFEAGVKKAAQDAAASNPKLKAGQVSGASSVDHAGGSGERRSDKPKSLDDAVAGHYGT